jgi:DNA-binding HxlR family transcriptional regulator
MSDRHASDASPGIRSGVVAAGSEDAAAAEADRAAAEIRDAVTVLCRRWRSDIVWHLRRGPLRYTALLSRLPAVAHKVLTDQLRALEREGVVARHVIRGGARHVEYRLTELGAALPPILDRLRAWGIAHAARQTALHGVRQSPRQATPPATRETLPSAATPAAGAAARTIDGSTARSGVPSAPRLPTDVPTPLPPPGTDR